MSVVDNIVTLKTDFDSLVPSAAPKHIQGYNTSSTTIREDGCIEESGNISSFHHVVHVNIEHQHTSTSYTHCTVHA